MKTIPILLSTLIFAQLSAQDDMPDSVKKSLQRGLMEEEVNRDFKAAAEAYRTAVEEFDVNRATAAAALFRLAECTRRLGQTNEAWGFYQRLVREFGDQTNLVALSQKELAAMPRYQQRLQSIVGRSGASGASGAGAEQALARQRQLLEQELALVETQLEIQQKQVSAGVISSTELILTQRDVLSIKRQIAELDARALRGDRFMFPEASPDAGRDGVGDRPPHDGVWYIVEKGDTISSIVRGHNASRDREGFPLRTSMALILAANPGLDLNALRIGQRIVIPLRDKDSLEGAAAASGAADEEDQEIERFRGFLRHSPDLIHAGQGVGRRPPLYTAAQRGWLRLAEFLIANGAAVAAPDSQGNTALHAASAAGNKAMVELLLQHGAEVNAVNKQGSRPLHFAAALGMTAVAEVLLDAGADIKARCRSDRIDLQSNPRQGLHDLEVWAGTALHQAAGWGHLSTAELLLRRGADIDATADGVRTTALHRALHYQRTRVASLLIEKGADVNLLDAGGSSVVYLVISRIPELIDQVLARKPDLEVHSSSELTPLQLAFIEPDSANVEKLLEAQANPNAVWLSRTTTSGWRQRGSAIRSNVNFDNAYGQTLLHLGAEAGDTNLCGLLLKYRADVEARNSSAQTPLFAAAGSNPGQSQVMLQLLEAGANVNVVDQHGSTPLHYAVWNHNTEQVELLLRRGADPKAVNPQGVTPELAIEDPRFSETARESMRAIFRAHTKSE